MEPPAPADRVADRELRAGQYRRVLVIGAHPDEDTGLITVLVRGEGAVTAYLSLNRGEGGQNLIGPELGEALGLLRTEELLSARSLDGGRQYFTRAYDFGYSKTLDDTWQHWQRDSILKDVVRVIRQFQPQIIVSVFSGTPEDGHGQHQAAGWARSGFEAAADPRASGTGPRGGPRPGAPTSPAGARFTPVPNMFTIRPAGSTRRWVSRITRSPWRAARHRSQDMGAADPGPLDRIALVTDRGGRGCAVAGIDTRSRAVRDGSLAERLARRLARARTAAALAAAGRIRTPSGALGTSAARPGRGGQRRRSRSGQSVE
jgi:LmbE family N-acetylglucosaminyl deacetylase